VLFNSPEFLFAFLPLVLGVFAWLDRRRPASWGFAWLALASIFFYAWWRPVYAPLLLGSIAVNFGLGRLLAGPRRRRGLLALAVGANLALLGVFKYAGLAVRSVNGLLGADLPVPDIVLPIGISFFTFQCIAYLVDVAREGRAEGSPVRFALFVSFFPQLIAGPIVHHKEVLPQFTARAGRRLSAHDGAVGLTFFVMGLFKKVVLADSLAGWATPQFDAVAAGQALGAAQGWLGVLAYSFQIYFDFSGYSDMAIGLGRLFGIRLPENFASPYQASGPIDFWRRWHRTLSRFLRDYLYIPLGGNRRGRGRRYGNLMATMVLGGLWHGASWNFALWGGFHGLLLVANHGWRALRRRAAGGEVSSAAAGAWGLHTARALTFLAVSVAWVPFRAADLPSAGRMLGALVGAHGALAGPPIAEPGVALAWLCTCLAIVWGLPNSQTWMRRFEPILGSPPAAPAGWRRHLAWRPSPGWAVAVSAGLALCLLRLSRVSEFIYFNF